MNNNVKYLFAFTLGAVVGVAASWKVMETKYRKIADEEIESVKEMLSKKTDNESENVEDDLAVPEVDDEQDDTEESETKEVAAYNTIIKTQQYHNNYSVINKEGEASGEDKIDRPYIIDQSEVGELDYEIIELTYYEGDNTLADELDELVDDVEDTVGWDNLDKFGDYDSICIRNDARRVDFEILLDVRKFSEVTYLRQYEN